MTTLELLEKFSEQGLLCTTLEELESLLSDEFVTLYQEQNEAQYAYNELNHRYSGLLDAFVYTLSPNGVVWEVSVGGGYLAEKLSYYIEAFQSRYDEKLTTLDDLLAALERRVGKDMDNAGIDAHHALREILFDLELDDEFEISGADNDPRIVHLDRIFSK